MCFLVEASCTIYGSLSIKLFIILLRQEIYSHYGSAHCPSSSTSHALCVSCFRNKQRTPGTSRDANQGQSGQTHPQGKATSQGGAKYKLGAKPPVNGHDDAHSDTLRPGQCSSTAGQQLLAIFDAHCGLADMSPEILESGIFARDRAL